MSIAVRKHEVRLCRTRWEAALCVWCRVAAATHPHLFITRRRTDPPRPLPQFQCRYEQLSFGGPRCCLYVSIITVNPETDGRQIKGKTWISETFWMQTHESSEWQKQKILWNCWRLKVAGHLNRTVPGHLSVLDLMVLWEGSRVSKVVLMVSVEVLFIYWSFGQLGAVLCGYWRVLVVL